MIKLEYRFWLNVLKLKTQHFHTKMPCQKSMLRQTEWGVQDELIAKNGDLPVTSSFFWKYGFNLRTSGKELIWCADYLNPHIHTFRLDKIGEWVFFKYSVFARYFCFAAHFPRKKILERKLGIFVYSVNLHHFFMSLCFIITYSCFIVK